MSACVLEEVKCYMNEEILSRRLCAPSATPIMESVLRQTEMLFRCALGLLGKRIESEQYLAVSSLGCEDEAIVHGAGDANLVEIP